MHQLHEWNLKRISEGFCNGRALLSLHVINIFLTPEITLVQKYDFV